MEFQEILAYTPTNIGMICVPLIIITMAFLIGTLFAIAEFMDRSAEGSRSSKDVKKMTITAISSFLGLCFFAISFHVVLGFSNDFSADNDESLISNIEKKYDVDEVNLNFGENKTTSEMHKIQSVHVVVDDVTYEFYLTQDKKTWEPTLSNPAVRGGSSDTQNLSAEDLLK